MFENPLQFQVLFRRLFPILIRKMKPFSIQVLRKRDFLGLCVFSRIELELRIQEDISLLFQPQFPAREILRLTFYGSRFKRD